MLKKNSGKRPKKRPVDPKKRAEKRLRQAGRAYDRKRDDKNEARIKALEAGTWPSYAPAAPVEVAA